MIFSSEALWKVYLCSRPLDLGSANVVEDSEVEQDDQQEGDDGDEKDTKIPGCGQCSVEDKDDSDVNVGLKKLVSILRFLTSSDIC